MSSEASLFSSQTALSSFRVLPGYHSERSEESRSFFLKNRLSQQPEMCPFAHHDRDGSFRVTNWVFQSSFAKTFEPQHT
jgi:hypothetical protein